MSRDSSVEFGVDFALTDLSFEELVDDMDAFGESDVVISEHFRFGEWMRRRRWWWWRRVA